jgi:hypothetical protein
MVFELGKCYRRESIAVEDTEERYLPLDGAGKVAAGCFRYDLNPDAPDIVLPGTGPIIESSADEFRLGGYAVPTFIKLDVGEWQYVGNYRVANSSKAPELIEQHQKRAEQYGRTRTRREWKITQVLYLEPVGDYYDWREGVPRKARERESPRGPL